MADEAELPGRHPEEAAVGIPVHIMAGGAGDPAAIKRKALDLPLRYDVDLMFRRRCSVAVTVQAELRQRSLQFSTLGSIGRMTAGTVLLDLRKGIGGGLLRTRRPGTGRGEHA